MAKQLILIRHGEVTERYQGRFIGSTDAPLSKEGKSQILKFRTYIRQFPEAAFFYSPLLRATESFKIAIGDMQVEANADDLLREVNFGDWECLKYTEIQQQFPDVYAAWQRKWSLDFTYPNGESHRHLVDRIKTFGDKARAHDSETVIAFTHGAVIMFLLCALLELESANYRLFSMKRGSRSIVDISHRPGVLMELNCLNP